MNPLCRRLRFSLACMLAAFATIPNLGCDQTKPRAIPAPLKDPVEQTYTGKITKVWGGNNFEFVTGVETHYLILRGVATPDPGYYESKRETKKLALKKQVTVHAFARDEVMREIVDVIVPVGKTKGDFDGGEFNLGVELTKRGWGLYNGESFDGAEQLIEAQAYAKENKLGIWAKMQEEDKKDKDKEEQEEEPKEESKVQPKADSKVEKKAEDAE